MRKRTELTDELIRTSSERVVDSILLEVLMDIRELLEEIKGTVRDGAVEVWSQPD